MQEPGMVTHAYNPSMWETEAGGLQQVQVKGQFVLYGETISLKKKKHTQENPKQYSFPKILEAKGVNKRKKEECIRNSTTSPASPGKGSCHKRAEFPGARPCLFIVLFSSLLRNSQKDTQGMGRHMAQGSVLSTKRKKKKKPSNSAIPAPHHLCLLGPRIQAMQASSKGPKFSIEMGQSFFMSRV